MTTRAAERAKTQGTGKYTRRDHVVPDAAFPHDWAILTAPSGGLSEMASNRQYARSKDSPTNTMPAAPSLSTEIIQERLRIAQEIHDGALQLLGCVRLNVERLLTEGALDQHAIKNELELCLEWLDAGLVELRHSVVGLREGKDESLLPSLQRLVEDVRRFYKLDIDLSWQVHVALPERVQSTVLRVAQEALHNAAKHARAESVSVVVRTSGNDVTLTVQDNGVGIDEGTLRASSGSGRYGLKDMRKKAAAAGGRLKVTGIRGQGTCVSLTLPVRHAVGASSHLETLCLSTHV